MQEFALNMDPADWKWFRNHVGSKRCFPAELTVDEETWPVHVGYRGRYTRRFRKPSYDLWFSAEKPFDGQRALHLNAAYRDPSLFRGRLALDLFQSIDVPSPKVSHRRFSINDEKMGVYSVIESLDETWLERNGMAGGAIYYGVGSGATMGLLDVDNNCPKQHLSVGYEKRCPDDDDFSDIEELILNIALPGNDAFPEQITRVIDVEQFLRWLIGIVFVSHTDGVVQNYALIKPPEGLWRISPWDCDGTFGRVPGGGQLPADDMTIMAAPDNHLIARLLTSDRWRLRYLELWDRFLSGPLSWNRIALQAQSIYEEIRPAVLEDERKGFSSQAFDKEPSLMRHFLKERVEFLRAEVDAWRVRRNLPWHPRNLRRPHR